MSEKINTDIGEEPHLEWVAIDLIDVDSTYQRDVVPYRVRRILAEFRWRDFQPVSLARQTDGRYAVIDGQHRVHAARLHPNVAKVPAAIIDLAGAKRGEAAAFVTINTERTAVSAVDRYWAGLEAGDDTAMAICAVLERAGCDVVAAQGQLQVGKTNAVSALGRTIKTYDEDATVRALTIIREAWPNDPKALKGTLIRALARIVANTEDFDDARMTTVIQDQSMAELTAHAEAMRKISGGASETSIARTLTEQYNRGRRTRLACFGAAS